MATKRKLTKQTLEELAKIYPQNAEIFSMTSSGGCGSLSDPMTWEEYLAYKRGEISGEGSSGQLYYYDQSGDLQSENIITIVIDEIDVVGNSNWYYGLSFYDRTWINMYHGLTGNMDYDDVPPTGSMDGSQGGGGPVGDQYFKSIELMDINKFVPYNVTGDCMKGAVAIMSKYGLIPDLTRRVEFVTAKGVAVSDIVQEATIIVDECFRKKQPLVAGVRTLKGGDKNVGQYANHFVVITGRGTDSKGMYFTYMETGVSDVNVACNTVQNRFYLNVSTNIWEEDALCYSGESAHITEFRPNNFK